MFPSCEHVSYVKLIMGNYSYKILHAYYVVHTAKILVDASCCICEALNGRQHACLECVAFGCFRKRHIHQHAEQEGHFVAMDIATGYIYCCKCMDYIYDEEFDNIAREQKQEALLKGHQFYYEWMPSKKEIQYLRRNQFRTVKVDSAIGLRGLYNLTCTCYMNAVVQVLVHIPLLRNYFFADKHQCHDDKDQCWGCIMSSIFQEFYSGCTSPLSLDLLLYVLWRDFRTFNLDMQDSEEFYSTILDALHFCESKGNNCLSKKGHCQCMIHQIFSGFSESKIECMACGYATKKDTSFWDVNLDFGPDHIENCKKNSRKSASQFDYYHPQNVRPSEPGLFLESLIQSYTDAESLLSRCGNCSNEYRTIQATFKKLPMILCFHLKRKVITNGVAQKISTQVFFPVYLDMAPYLSAPANGITNESDNTVYRLFAVLVHKGHLNGHNFSYIRMHNSWFKCDDEVVYEVEIEEMLNSEGYLLYYHKCLVEYESDTSSSEI